MFADDTNLFFTEKCHNSVFKEANQELKLVDNWLLSNKLSLNINKTSYIVFRTPNTPLPVSNNLQRWSRGHKARGQGQGQGHKKNPRPRTAFPRTDTLEAKAKDQGHKAQVLSKKKKKGLHKNFSSDLHEKTLSKKFFNRFIKF